MKSFRQHLHEAAKELPVSEYSWNWHDANWILGKTVCTLLQHSSPALLQVAYTDPNGHWRRRSTPETGRWITALRTHFAQIGGNKPDIGVLGVARTCLNRAAWSQAKSGTPLWRGKGSTLQEVQKILSQGKVERSGRWVSVEAPYVSKYSIQSWTDQESMARQFATEASTTDLKHFGIKTNVNAKFWTLMRLRDFKPEETLFGEYRDLAVSYLISGLHEVETIRLTNRPVQVRYWFSYEQLEAAGV